MINRRKARVTVIQALYASQVGEMSPEDVISQIIKPALSDSKENLQFAESLFLKSLKSLEDLDSDLQSQVENWDLSRLATLDKIIIKAALVEIREFSQIPVKVSINEAIEIAKSFSTDQSGKFVNGILDGIRKKWNESGLIQKEGRGLIDKSTRRGR